MTQQHLKLGKLPTLTGPGVIRCSRCLRMKPVRSFYQRGNNKPDDRCIQCDKVLEKFRRSDYPARMRARFYKAQNGLCPVCAQPLDLADQLALDHPHTAAAMQNEHAYAAAITGLLHPTCNAGIGMLNDDPTVLRRAARYVKRTRHKSDLHPYAPLFRNFLTRARVQTLRMRGA